MESNYGGAAMNAPRQERVIEGITERIRKLDANIVHAIGQASELRARLLGEREPSQISKASDGRVPTPISCDTDELRKAIAGMEANIETLHGHLENLQRL